MSVANDNSSNFLQNRQPVVSLWKEVSCDWNPEYWEIPIRPHGNVSANSILSVPAEGGKGSIIKIAASRFYHIDFKERGEIYEKFRDRPIYFTYGDKEIKCINAHSSKGVSFTTPNLTKVVIANIESMNTGFKIKGEFSELWSVNVELYRPKLAYY